MVMEFRMKRISLIIVLIIAGSFIFSQGFKDAFNPKRNKGAVFKYTKEEFYKYVNSNISIDQRDYSKYYNFHTKMELKIDTNGNVRSLDFIDFVYDSDYTSLELFVSANNNNTETFKYVKEEIKRIVYSTSGLWLPKLKKDKKEVSLIHLRLSVDSKSVFNLIEYPYSDSLKNAISAGLNSSEQVLSDATRGVSYSNQYLIEATRKIYVKRPIYSEDYKFNLAKVYMTQNKTDFSEKYLIELVKNSKRAEFYVLLGDCSQELSKKQEACKNWATAFQLGDKTVKDKLVKNCN